MVRGSRPWRRFAAAFSPDAPGGDVTIVYLRRRLVPASGRNYRRLRTLVDVSEPVRDVPAYSEAMTAAVANARRGVITHLTIAGERVAAIVPESVIEALRSAEDAEDAAEADAAWDAPGESIPLEELEAELGR